MRYIRTITRQRPAAAQYEEALAKVNLGTVIVSFALFLQDSLDLFFNSKDESSGS